MNYRKLRKAYIKESRHGIWLPLVNNEGKTDHKLSRKGTAILIRKVLGKGSHGYKWLLEQIAVRDKSNAAKLGIADGNQWKDYLSESKKIVVFDTETTGFKPDFNYILSLSWQVLDNNLNTIDRQTRYFKNPLPESKCKGAIKVNGLTNAKLEELGTTDKKQALEEFSNILKDATLLVGHNAKFDIGFIVSECKRAGVDSNINDIPVFDTMRESEKYCNLYKASHWRKWPKLIELATMLGVETSDIDWHKSSSDVEVTARCLGNIAERGLTKAPTARQ